MDESVNENDEMDMSDDDTYEFSGSSKRAKIVKLKKKVGNDAMCERLLNLIK